MDVVIVTGASKGLGAALVHRLLSADRRVIGIARSANGALEAVAREQDAWLDWYLHDLADVAGTDTLARSICADLPLDAGSYALINNAAVADPVGPIATLDAAQIAAAAHVNLASTMVFTARFLEATAALESERRILNISSGLARRPMDGTAVYCATKAGLDMFTRCINAEPHDPQRARTKAKAVALAPGVIDTDMQVFMRGQDPATFPAGRQFQSMKDEGRLVSADAVAQKIVAYLDRGDFGVQEIDDIRDG